LFSYLPVTKRLVTYGGQDRTAVRLDDLALRYRDLNELSARAAAGHCGPAARPGVTLSAPGCDRPVCLQVMPAA